VQKTIEERFYVFGLVYCFIAYLPTALHNRPILHTLMARHSLFVPKVPLNTNQLTNQPYRQSTPIAKPKLLQ